MMSAVPLMERAVADEVSVIVDPLGARSGTFSQATATSEKAMARALRGIRPEARDMIKLVNILNPMHLDGQGQARRRGKAWATERGYAMVALLVGLGVMAVMMTVAMPVWKHAAQREKEEELIFRGKQYARAIELYGRKLPGALPASIDVLVDQKFLRRKYKDPITGEDFDLVSPNSPAATQATQPANGRSGQTGRAAPGAPNQQSRFSTPGGTIGLQAGVVGVVSKSKDTSIRIYNGRSHYNEWLFQYTPRQQAPGAPGAPGGPGQRGGPNQPPGPIGPGGGRGGVGGRDGRGGPQGPFPGGGRGGPGGQPFPAMPNPPVGGQGPAAPPQRPGN